MKRNRSKVLTEGNAILSVALAVLILAAFASMLMTGQNTPALAGSSVCLLGTHTAEESATLNNPVTGTQQDILVRVTLNVTQVRKGEFLVTAVTTVVPQGGGKALIMFTPPLTDMVVYTDAGTFRWSQGKFFIQVIISKELPTTSKVEMKVKGECVKSVVIEVRPLKTVLTFGMSTGYPAEAPSQSTSVRGGENIGYVIMVSRNGSLRVFQLKKPVEGMALENYVVRNVTIPCNIAVGGIVVNGISVEVYAPKNLSEEQLEKALQPLSALCSGNLSGLRGMVMLFSNKSLREALSSFISPKFSYVSEATSTVTATKTTVLTIAKVTATTTATTTVTSTCQTVTGSTTTHVYPTVPTTLPQATSGTAVSASSGAAASTPLPLTTSSKAVAAVVALGAALVAGLVAYLVIVRRT